MGWLRLLGSLKLEVSFAEYSLFYRALLQKIPTILRRLLIPRQELMWVCLVKRVKSVLSTVDVSAFSRVLCQESRASVLSKIKSVLSRVNLNVFVLSRIKSHKWVSCKECLVNSQCECRVKTQEWVSCQDSRVSVLSRLKSECLVKSWLVESVRANRVSSSVSPAGLFAGLKHAGPSPAKYPAKSPAQECSSK